MSNAYCLIYFSSNKIYAVYGYLDCSNCLVVLNELDKKSIIPTTKFLAPDFELKDFIDVTFFKKDINFLTNLKSTTNFYKKIKAGLPDGLRSVDSISSEKLENLRFKVLDLLVGGEIELIKEVYKRRIFSLLEQDEITENLIPILYFVKYAKLSCLDWIKYL